MPSKRKPTRLLVCGGCGRTMVPNHCDNLGKFGTHHARGLCRSCYRDDLREQIKDTCSIKGCTTQAWAASLCAKHHTQKRRGQLEETNA